MAKKANRSFSMSYETFQRLDEMEDNLKKEGKKVSSSSLVERYVIEGLDRDTAVPLLCKKCGASYSSKLSECPGCKK